MRDLAAGNSFYRFDSVASPKNYPRKAFEVAVIPSGPDSCRPSVPDSALTYGFEQVRPNASLS